MSTIFLTDILLEKKHKRRSFGIVAYTLNPFRVLLAHPGGPIHAKKDKGYWSIPKGIKTKGESDWATACREFHEETGLSIPPGTKEKDSLELGKIVQTGGKIVRAWAVQMEDDDISQFRSNTFQMVWPPYKGAKEQTFPEIDRIQYFSYADAVRHIREDQRPLLDRLFMILNQAYHIKKDD